MKLKSGTITLLISIFFQGSSTAKELLACECISAESGCSFSVFDQAAGKPRKNWVQEYSPVPGRDTSSSDMAMACWRKRNTDAGGQGLCCEMDNDDRDAKRYFKGQLQ